MKFLTEENTRQTKFLRIFDDGAGVYARPLTETEKDKIRTKSRTVEKGEIRSEELFQRKYEILVLKESISGWELFEDSEGQPIPFDSEKVHELYEANPQKMHAVFQLVDGEYGHLVLAEEKNSAIGVSA